MESNHCGWKPTNACGWRRVLRPDLGMAGQVFPRFPFVGTEMERNGVDAITLPRRLSRTIIEDVPKMRTTILANHFCAAHKERPVLVQFQVFPIDRAVKAGPARTRVEFGVRGEQRLTARGAFIHTALVIVPQRTRKSAL